MNTCMNITDGKPMNLSYRYSVVILFRNQCKTQIANKYLPNGLFHITHGLNELACCPNLVIAQNIFIEYMICYQLQCTIQLCLHYLCMDCNCLNELIHTARCCLLILFITLAVSKMELKTQLEFFCTKWIKAAVFAHLQAESQFSPFSNLFQRVQGIYLLIDDVSQQTIFESLITYFSKLREWRCQEDICLLYGLVGLRSFKSNYQRVCLIIILMHRYGLVYLWHNKQLQNQNRSVTKERRDGQAPSPPRNKARLHHRQPNLHSKHPSSIQSDPCLQNSTKVDDVQVLESVEIRRAKAEVEKAKLRVQKALMDMAQAEKRVSEMQIALTSLAGGDSQSQKAYNNLLQLARRESERRQKERLTALGELQSKEQLLARLSYRKCSM